MSRQGEALCVSCLRRDPTWSRACAPVEPEIGVTGVRGLQQRETARRSTRTAASARVAFSALSPTCAPADAVMQATIYPTATLRPIVRGLRRRLAGGRRS